MKAVILAGGLGTRMSEETAIRPKPMVEVGGLPMLHHIMNTFGRHGIKEFIICLGYKGEVIKDYFMNLRYRESDLTISLDTGQIDYHSTSHLPWRVTLVETGIKTQTAGRLARVRQFLDDEPFFLTYGDGLSDVDLTQELEFHKAHARIATMLTVSMHGRFGEVELSDSNQNLVSSFNEKPSDSLLINGGFFILEKEVFEYLSGEESESFEQGPLRRLAHANQIAAFRHHGFWRACDTLRDKIELDEMCKEGGPPWEK